MKVCPFFYYRNREYMTVKLKLKKAGDGVRTRDQQLGRL